MTVRSKKKSALLAIAVNEIRAEEQVRFLIENDYGDFVAVGRDMLTDPEFANHVMNS